MRAARPPAVFANKPRDAEIEQLHAEPFGNHNIAWLYIGMDHQLAVRIFERRTGIAKQRQPCRQIEGVRLCIVGNRRAVDQLHDDIGCAVVANPAVKQMRDMWVMQPREDSPFIGELFLRGRGKDVAADDLNRDLLLKQAIVARTALDQPHAAAPDFLDDPVISNPFGHRCVGDECDRLGWQRRQ